ncbi:IclR family transcriptional regulator [Diplocloster agilis]|uniref:IclR family transcriptional regulator n=1 Tax=Diplocloster agilis TaxID=2850323 RepID=A0A949NFE2_9FIRM|nr:IclR family transcriptional regulator [Diplocloster agilis]MBU9735048.1 IclR family transcriptional regulator [Diplocloster agilis]
MNTTDLKKDNVNLDTAPKTSYAPKTIGKVLAVLECFSLEQPELTAEQIKEKLGLSTSTLYRYLLSMEEEGYLLKNTVTGRYTLGLHIIELAGIALSQMDLRRHGQIELDQLSLEIGLNTNLGVLYQGDIFHIAFSIPHEVDKMYAVLGRRTAAHVTAMGKAVYANMPQEVVRGIITQYGWRPCTKKSITNFQDLFEELKKTNQRGYSLDCEENSVGSWCIGAPVFKSGGEVVGALSATGTTEYMKQNLGTVSRAVMEQASHLSSKLGYIGSYFQK